MARRIGPESTSVSLPSLTPSPQLGGGGWQWPPTQVSPVLQAVEQVPQWLVLVFRSNFLPHLVSQLQWQRWLWQCE